MMSGGCPSQLVWTMTWTSEVSGRGSGGTGPSARIPASTRPRTPAKTRKRLCAHHSMIREIMALHPSRRVHGEMLGGERPPLPANRNGHLPGAAGLETALALVPSAPLIGGLDRRVHPRHAHGRHRPHG